MDRAVRRRFDEIEEKLNSLSGSSSSNDIQDLVTKLVSTVALVETSHSKLMDRVAALESKPEPKPVDLSALEARISALEKKPVVQKQTIKKE